MDNEEYVSVKASQYKVLMALAVQYCLGLEQRLRLSIINQPQNINLGRVFDGLQSGFEGHFRAAQIIQISMFKGDAYVGWNRLDDKTFTKKEIVRQAQNVDYLSRCVWKLLSPFQRSRDVYMDMSLRLVEDCREFLLGIKAEVILRGWQKRLTASASQHKREYFDRILDSCSQQDRFLQKYGQRIATELISEEIATGKVYQGKNPHVCKQEDVIRYLYEAAKRIIDIDKQIQAEEQLQNN